MNFIKLITFLQFFIVSSSQGDNEDIEMDCLYDYEKSAWTNQNSVNDEDQTWMFDTDYTMDGPYQDHYTDYETITKIQTDNETINYLLV